MPSTVAAAQTCGQNAQAADSPADNYPVPRRVTRRLTRCARLSWRRSQLPAPRPRAASREFTTSLAWTTRRPTSPPAPTATSGSPSRACYPAIGRITPSGDDHRVPPARPAHTGAPATSPAGPDGALWFTERGVNGEIGRLDPGTGDRHGVARPPARTPTGIPPARTATSGSRARRQRRDRPHHSRGRDHRVHGGPDPGREAQRHRRRPRRRHLVHARARTPAASAASTPNGGVDRVQRRHRQADRGPNQIVAPPTASSTSPSRATRARSRASRPTARRGVHERPDADSAPDRDRRGRRRRALVHRGRRAPAASAASGRPRRRSPSFDGRHRGSNLLAGAEPAGITRGPDGNIWFTERGLAAASAASRSPPRAELEIDSDGATPPRRSRRARGDGHRRTPAHDLPRRIRPDQRATAGSRPSVTRRAARAPSRSTEIVELTLAPGAHYHARVVATNGSGVARSHDAHLWVGRERRAIDSRPGPHVPRRRRANPHR